MFKRVRRLRTRGYTMVVMAEARLNEAFLPWGPYVNPSGTANLAVHGRSESCVGEQPEQWRRASVSAAPSSLGNVQAPLPSAAFCRATTCRHSMVQYCS